MSDPVMAKKSIKDDDSELVKMKALVDGIHSVFGDTPFTVKELAKADDLDLKDILMSFSKDEMTINNKKIGNALTRLDGRVLNGKYLAPTGKKQKNYKEWHIILDTNKTNLPSSTENTGVESDRLVRVSYEKQTKDITNLTHPIENTQENDSRLVRLVSLYP